MAYADRDVLSRPQPLSMGMTLVVNALLVTGIIFANPEIVPEHPFGNTTVIDVKKEPPVKIKETVKKVDEKAKPQDFTPYVAEKTAEQAGPDPDTGFASAATGLGESLGGLGGLGGTGDGKLYPDPDPIVIPDPVLTTAKVDPRFARSLQPAYPPGKAREGAEGKVVVRVLISTEGRVKRVDPVRFDDAAFLEATTKQALSKWRFVPATRDGVAVESWREMIVRFEMPD